MSINSSAIKFYVTGGDDLDQKIFIPVFQEWIKNKTLDDVMIDIADYRHVPNGPGMMMVCHERNYSLDSAEDNTLGLLVHQRQPVEGAHKDAILNNITAGLKFLKALANDANVPGGLTFDVSSFEYLANDRLNVENSDAGLEQISGDLQAVAAVLYPDQDVTIVRRENHSKSRLAVRVTGNSDSSVDALLIRTSA